MTETVIAAPARLRHLVAGRWSDPRGAELIDTNPARPEEIVARGTLAGQKELEAAVRGAIAAFPEWAATPFPLRGEVLLRAAAVIRVNDAEQAVTAQAESIVDEFLAS